LYFFRAPIDLQLLEEYPDVRIKTAKKLEWVGNEQLSILRLLMQVFSYYVPITFSLFCADNSLHTLFIFVLVHIRHILMNASDLNWTW